MVCAAQQPFEGLVQLEKPNLELSSKEVREGDSNHIIYNNEYYPIDWDKVVLPFNANGLKLTKGLPKGNEAAQA
jgi:hypothetical protein